MPDSILYQLAAFVLTAIYRKDPVLFAEKCLRLVFNLVSFGLAPRARRAWRDEFWLDVNGRAERWMLQGLDDIEVARRLLWLALEFAIQGWGVRGAYGRVHNFRIDDVLGAMLGWYAIQAWWMAAGVVLLMPATFFALTLVVGVVRGQIRTKVVSFTVLTVRQYWPGILAGTIIVLLAKFGNVSDSPLVLAPIGYGLARCIELIASHIGYEVFERAVSAKLEGQQARGGSA